MHQSQRRFENLPHPILSVQDIRYRYRRGLARSRDRRRASDWRGFGCGCVDIVGARKGNPFVAMATPSASFDDVPAGRGLLQRRLVARGRARPDASSSRAANPGPGLTEPPRMTHGMWLGFDKKARIIKGMAAMRKSYQRARFLLAAGYNAPSGPASWPEVVADRSLQSHHLAHPQD